MQTGSIYIILNKCQLREKVLHFISFLHKTNWYLNYNLKHFELLCAGIKTFL